MSTYVCSAYVLHTVLQILRSITIITSGQTQEGEIRHYKTQNKHPPHITCPTFNMTTSINSKLLLLSALFYGGNGHSSSHSSEVDCTKFFCELELSDTLVKRYKITVPDGNTDSDCADCKITVQLELDGYSWIGMGVTGSGGMVGSHVVM